MEENRISAITKEKTDVLTDAYKETLNILNAYDHQTLTRPEGTSYDKADGSWIVLWTKAEYTGSGDAVKQNRF